MVHTHLDHERKLKILFAGEILQSLDQSNVFARYDNTLKVVYSLRYVGRCS